uniref:FIG001590: Putative conserved exported protein n=1 Tax=Rheinheimera sp. BAL341 TaxID=1708203 RepID=A0A486XSW6_9GAMM
MVLQQLLFTLWAGVVFRRLKLALFRCGGSIKAVNYSTNGYMSSPFILSYDEWTYKLDQAYVMASAAEVHGLIAGLLSAGVEPDAQQLLPVLHDFLNDGQALSAELKQQVVGLIDTTHTALAQNDFSFALLLPSDDDSLPERLDAMVEWTQAFLVGFAVQQTDLSLVSNDVREALDQLSEVTRIDIHTTDDGSAEENDEAYYLVLEHIRIMVLSCYTEVGQKFSPKPVSNKTLH